MDWGHLVAVGAVVMVISYTIAKERVFAPLRAWLGGRETWTGYLASCPFCASWWIAFVIVPVTGTMVIDVPWDWGFVATVIEWFLSSALVVTVAAFLRVAFFVVDEVQGFVRRRSRTEEVEREVLEHRVEHDDVGHRHLRH